MVSKAVKLAVQRGSSRASGNLEGSLSSGGRQGLYSPTTGTGNDGGGSDRLVGDVNVSSFESQLLPESTAYMVVDPAVSVGVSGREMTEATRTD